MLQLTMKSASLILFGIRSSAYEDPIADLPFIDDLYFVFNGLDNFIPGRRDILSWGALPCQVP